MRKECKNLTVNLIDSWDEVSLKQYLRFVDVLAVFDENEPIQSMLRTFLLVEILCDLTEEEVDLITENEMEDISIAIAELIKNFTFSSSDEDHFEIEGVEYVKTDMKDLTNGEYISLNMLREQYTTNLELYPRLLAVLLRPGHKETDTELNKDVWIIDKFNRRDIKNLEMRAELFLNKAKAKDVAPILTFFLTMKQI